MAKRLELSARVAEKVRLLEEEEGQVTVVVGKAEVETAGTGREGGRGDVLGGETRWDEGSEVREEASVVDVVGAGDTSCVSDSEGGSAPAVGALGS
jgi:hypothetical protein